MRITILILSLFVTIFTTEFKEDRSSFNELESKSVELRSFIEKGKIAYQDRKMSKSYDKED